MSSRTTLQGILEGVSGVKKVYFQPPENLKLEFPCIIYKRDYLRQIFANNEQYMGMKRYMVTVIYSDPDSTIPDILSNLLPTMSFVRTMVNDRMYHDVYNLYY